MNNQNDGMLIKFRDDTKLLGPANLPYETVFQDIYSGSDNVSTWII